MQQQQRLQQLTVLSLIIHYLSTQRLQLCSLHSARAVLIPAILIIQLLEMFLPIRQLQPLLRKALLAHKAVTRRPGASG